MTQNTDLGFSMRPNLPGVIAAEKMLGAGVDFQFQVLNATFQAQMAAIDFFVRRSQQQAKLISALADSAQYNDALDVIGDFVRVAKIDFATEASEILMITSTMTSQAAQSIRDQADATLDDIAARTIV